MATYSLLAATAPPLNVGGYSGDLVAGLTFAVGQGSLWLYGYYIYVPAGGDTEAGQKCCLYQVTGSDVGSIVPGSTAVAGALTAGQWNLVSLATPLLLSPGVTPAAGPTYGAAYMACTGKVYVLGFPQIKNVFGSADPDSGGITNGPLSAFSSTGGAAPVGGSGGLWVPQMAFTTTLGDPTAGMPTQNDADDNLGIDVLVSTVAPASPTYRMLPNTPVFNVPGTGAQEQAYTLGTTFKLTAAGNLVRIWHYSAPGSTVLPSRCGIWNTVTQTEVAGTDNSAPVWSGAAGSGWVSCTYAGLPSLPTGVVLAVSTFTSAETSPWFLAQTSWWTEYASGITQGIVEYTGTQYNLGNTWAYPATTGAAEYDGVDVEIQPASAPAPSGDPDFVTRFRL